MNVFQAFFPLIGRASVIWLSILGMTVVTIIVSGLAQEDGNFAAYVDATFAAAFLFPASAGWIAGAVIRELQHTTFAMFLPSIRFRLAIGYITAGLLVSVLIVGLIAAMNPLQYKLFVLLAIGLGGYSLSSIMVDSTSNWVAALMVVLILAVVTNSGELQRLTNEYSWLTTALMLGVGFASVSRLFSRSTFRKNPFKPISPLPGRFAFEKSRQNQQRLKIKGGPVEAAWKSDYLGNDPWRWVRAAIHETYGANFVKALSKSIAKAWGLGLLILVSAWLDKGEMRFTEALAWSINDALLRSPFQPQFGEHGGPYPLVIIVIAAIGAVTALFSPVALNDSMYYPLSRIQRALVQFRGGLVDAAIFLFIITPCLLIIGYLTGWSVGFEIRFDFMPFFLRVLLLTLVLMPMAYWGRLQLQEATWRKAENNMVAVIIGIVGFVILVSLLTALSGAIFDSPGIEVAVLITAILTSRLIYWRSLLNFYTTADLA